MKVAVVGSRGISVRNLENYLPNEVTEIISGGARRVDSCAKEYALKNNLRYTEFLPEYNKYGKAALLIGNLQIIDYSDKIIAFWDGISRGTEYVIKMCKMNGKNIDIISSFKSAD